MSRCMYSLQVSDIPFDSSTNLKIHPTYFVYAHHFYAVSHTTLPLYARQEYSSVLHGGGERDFLHAQESRLGAKQKKRLGERDWERLRDKARLKEQDHFLYWLYATFLQKNRTHTPIMYAWRRYTFYWLYIIFYVTQYISFPYEFAACSVLTLLHIYEYTQLDVSCINKYKLLHACRASVPWLQGSIEICVWKHVATLCMTFVYIILKCVAAYTAMMYGVQLSLYAYTHRHIHIYIYACL